MKNKFNIYIVLLTCLLLCTIISKNAAALIESYYDNKENTYTLTDDGKSLLSLTMDSGIITMSAYSATATSGIRYRTIGLAITKNSIAHGETAKGYTGPYSIGSAAGSTAYVWFTKTNTEPDKYLPNGQTLSVKYIPVSDVEEAVYSTWGIGLDDLKKDQILYFHAIFETYNAGTNVIRDTDIRSWKKIMNAEWWGASSLEGFSKYYNMYLRFEPGLQTCNIKYLESENLSNIKDPLKLGEYEIGNSVKWNDQPATINTAKGTYKLDKYYITYGKSVVKQKTVTLSDVENDIKKLQSGTYNSCVYGGVVINLVYKLSAEPNYMTYKTVGGSNLRTKDDLEDKKIGEKLTWTNKYPTIKDTTGKTYELVKYNITSNKTKEVIKPDSTTTDINKLLTGSYTPIPAGGVSVNMIYDRVKQPNEIIYETTDGNKIGIDSLASQYIGEDVSWSGIPENQKYDSKDYEVYSSYVIWKNDDTQTKREKRTVAGVGKAAILSNKSKVQYKGIEVHIVYKLKNAPPPPDIPNIPDDPEIPQADSVMQQLPSATSYGTIQADNRYTNKFKVEQGIPTTESLYTEAYSTEYLLGYDLEKKVGINTYTVKIQKTYNLTWKIPNPEYEEPEKGKTTNVPKELTEKEAVTVTQYTTVKRSFGYWEINNFDLYRIGYATIYNYALPGGYSTMYANTGAGYSYPSVSINHSSSQDYHIILPTEISNGITLPPITIDGGKAKPSVPSEDLTVGIDEIVPKLNVRSDSLVINGVTVISSAVTEWDAPDINKDFLIELRDAGLGICNEDVLYKNDQVIETTKSNGVFSTYGSVTYVSQGSVNSKYGYSYQNPIHDLSTVTIHTPVYCEVFATGDNDQYVQLIKPTNSLQVVLDENNTYNDFTVHISNTGFHTNRLGYGAKDYSYSVRTPDLSYIKMGSVLRNEVQFPFDVYILQGEVYKFIPRNTWVVLGRGTGTFHLPMWVTEGVYKVKCRSVAVNANESLLDQISEYRANTQIMNYVATDYFNIEVSGRIYGLSIYDITDYPIWEDVFRAPNSLKLKINSSAYLTGVDKNAYSKSYSYDYTLGTKDQYGNSTGRKPKYTFPLINGSHPFYTNIGILKTGYAVRFKLTTQGSMFSSGNYVKITPSFYYVDKNGNNRTAIDLYYSETINGKKQNLVKIGSILDKNNVKSMYTGSPYIGIPTAELKNTALIQGVTYPQILDRKGSIFTYGQINITSLFRTFINIDYMNNITNGSQYTPISNSGITASDMVKQKQNWYGSYYLPAKVHAVAKDFDVIGYSKQYGIDFKESFWKTGGYIIVNFEIVTVDSTGAERLSYINANNYLNNGNLSMWLTEGPVSSKTDNKGKTLSFKAGDFIIYSTDDSVKDDYSVGGLY